MQNLQSGKESRTEFAADGRRIAHVLIFGYPLRGPGRTRHTLLLDAGQMSVQKPRTLPQGLFVAEHLSDIGELCATSHYERVLHGKNNRAANPDRMAQRRISQEIVCLYYGAEDRVLLWK